MNLREQKKAVTRQSLQQAAAMLTRQQPWDTVTVDDIASAAGVSRRTFFNYFESKEAVLTSASADRSEIVVAAVRDRPADESPWEVLRAGVRASLTGATPESVLAFRSLWHEPSQVDTVLNIRRDLEVRLSVQIHERMPSWTYTHAHLVVGLFLTATSVATTSWLLGPQTKPLLDVIDEVVGRVRIDPPQ